MNLESVEGWDKDLGCIMGFFLFFFLLILLIKCVYTYVYMYEDMSIFMLTFVCANEYMLILHMYVYI